MSLAAAGVFASFIAHDYLQEQLVLTTGGHLPLTMTSFEFFFCAVLAALLAPRADAYNGAIRAASRAGDPKGASRLLQQMSDAGVEPDAVSYSCAVHPRSLPPRFRRMRHRTNRAAGKKRKKRNRPNCSQQSPRPQVRARRPDLRPTGRPRAHAVDA